MQISKLKYDKRMILGTCFFLLMFLWAGIRFSFGGLINNEDFVNIITPLYSFLAILVLPIAISTFAKQDPLRKTWMLLTAGMILVFLGDLNWLIWSTIWGDRIPYPSPADFFYLLGYGVLCVGLISANRTIRTRLSASQYLLLITLTTVSISLASYYLFVPIVFSNEISIIEKTLDLAYPTLDIIRLILSLSILAYFGKGRLGLPWLFITASFITLSVTDLLFSYTTWNKLFTEDAMLNFGWPASYALIMTSAWLTISIHKSIPAPALSPSPLRPDVHNDREKELVNIHS